MVHHLETSFEERVSWPLVKGIAWKHLKKCLQEALEVKDSYYPLEQRPSTCGRWKSQAPWSWEMAICCVLYFHTLIY